jgi:SagB-type dehydrogenase family enzyme
MGADAAGAAQERSAPAEREGDPIVVPQAPVAGSMSLEEALTRRRSIRDFTDAAIGKDTLARLLWASQGVTDASGLRTAPSAGALYPLEVYAVTADGVFHYEPRRHRVVRQAANDVRRALARAALSQDVVRSAPLVVVIAAVPARTAVKYGQRAMRYVYLEAGHAAQNVLLQATALGLGAVPVGAFEDDAVHQVLLLPPAQHVIYIIPVGHPSR